MFIALIIVEFMTVLWLPGNNGPIEMILPWEWANVW
jgi:hypothetical protein